MALGLESPHQGGLSGTFGRKLTDRRRDYESLSAGSTPADRTMFYTCPKCGRRYFWDHTCKYLAEAELDQRSPPKAEVEGPTPSCETRDL